MPPDTTVTPVPDAAAVDRPTTDPAVSSRDFENRRGGSVFVVDFHQAGNSADYRTFGWSGQEQGHVWSLQSGSGLRLPPSISQTPLTVEIDFNIATGFDAVSAAVIRVFANGQPIGSAAASGWTRMRCDIPDGVIVPGEPIDLRFEHPCFVRMNFMNFGHDDRLLGLCFYAVRIYPPWWKPAMDRFTPRPPESRLIQPGVPPLPPSAASTERAIYHFRTTEPGRRHLREGWLYDPNGEVWADDRRCKLELPVPAIAEQCLALITLCPLYIRNFMTSQRITILLSGGVIGQYRIGTDTCLAIPLPLELVNLDGTLRFTFVMPDGLPMHSFYPDQKPNFLSFLLESIEIVPLPRRHAVLATVRDDDVTRPAPIATADRFLDESVDDLPAAVKAALGIEMAEILQHFESLGDNCGFGLAQRKGGCEVLGLLRFANTPLKNLMIALDDEFAAAADKAELRLRLPDGPEGEYCLYADRYGIRWHTSAKGNTSDQKTIFAQQTMRLGYLRRKFYEALRAGRKIAAVVRAEPRKHPIPLPLADEPRIWEEDSERLRFAELLPLFLCLNEYGPNTLLYITRTSHRRRSGTVELIAPGVMRGYIDSFVILADQVNGDHADWLRIAVNAWLLDKGPNAAFRDTSA